MKRYLYSGPMQSLELRVPDPAAGEGVTTLLPIDCIPGKSVEMPEDHSVTRAMKDAGLLAEPPAVTVAPIAAETVPATAEVEASPLADDAATQAPNRSRVRAGTETPKE